MKIFFSLSAAMRAVFLAFVAGFVFGIPLGYQAGAPAAPAPISVESRSQVPLVAEEAEQPCTPTSSS